MAEKTQKTRKDGKPDGRRNNRGKTRHKIDDEKLEIIEKAAGFGLNIDQIAALCGMSKATFDRKRSQGRTGARIDEAIERGRAITAERIAGSLMQRAMGMKIPDTKFFCHQGNIVSQEYDKILAPDVTAQIFYLKTQCGWRETTNLNVDGALLTGDAALVAKFSGMSDEELEKRAAELAAAKTKGK